MASSNHKYDVLVIGGGHAGVEAALAAARMGAKTLLMTHNLDNLGQMSCNPSIGGIGKSHLVKEIDALGGAMALAADHAGIQFRILNASKGPAVRATRVQTDVTLYKQIIRNFLEQQANLTLLQQTADKLLLDGQRVCGVISNLNLKFYAKTVILTVGTFLNGKIHVGLAHFAGGRAGDPAAISLAEHLRDLGLRVARLKTGTPPRIAGNSIDYNKLQAQPGDTPTPVFSVRGNSNLHPPQTCCYITQSNSQTHDIIRTNLDRSPLFTGIIAGTGPRYCPSIEDKIIRFADKTSHQIFVEPMGLNTSEIYPSGISTSLPFDVQIELVRSINGFEQANITRPGYAIEYDFFDPRDLQFSLESKIIPGLFLAGQINGTTGYEEAAAQGLIAGINAALQVQTKEAWSPRRDESYIGVMLEDLILCGTQEPYRMFTSRAEYRLMLREDNADLRLTEHGRKLGLISDQQWQIFNAKVDGIAQETAYLGTLRIKPNSSLAIAAQQILGQQIDREYTALELLRRPEVNYTTLQAMQKLANIEHKTALPEVAEQIEIQVKYAGYITRLKTEITRHNEHINTNIPCNFDYTLVHGLSTEVRQKLAQTKPHTIGQATKIPGITPAAISILLIYLKKCGFISKNSI